jgi:hypothetical protein
MFEIIRLSARCTCCFSFCSVDINECEDENSGCDTEADCINIEGSFRCQCKPGFIGDGEVCKGKINNIKLKNQNLTIQFVTALSCINFKQEMFVEYKYNKYLLL